MKHSTTPRFPAARTTALGVGLLFGSALLLTGCGGSTGSTATTQSPAGSIATATSSTKKADATKPDSGGAAPVSDQEFCAALKQAQPDLDSATGKYEAKIALLEAISDLYQSKNALMKMDGATMDKLSKACPDARDKVFKSTGVSTFVAL